MDRAERLGDVVIRRARMRDAAQLAKVYHHAFGPTTPEDVRRWMRRRAPPAETFVAVVDGVVASTVEVLYRDLIIGGVPIRTGGIAGVATRWEYRHRGLATRLMREAIRRIRSRGISSATLFTGTNLPAIRIYTRLGYSETSAWQVFREFRRPVDFLRTRFEYRSKWLPRTPFGTSLLRGWKSRLLLASPRWKATVTFEGKKFTVHPGRRGPPDVIVRGSAAHLWDCLGDRLAYEEYSRRRWIRVTRDEEDREKWRRILTREWEE